MDKIQKKKKQILEFLKRGEKTASEISIYAGLNYYKILDLLNELIKEGEIELINFRSKKYYKLKEKKDER